MNISELHAEDYARRHLLDSGIVAELKRNKIFIWTIRAEPGRLFIAIDRSANPAADMDTIRRIITEFLAPLNRIIEIQEVPMAGNCCYGVCHGCLNGDPNLQKIWIESRS